tara:strand:- start:567 stop:779 length:213 start_codon:yes stop_codon:yes gene_type:complete
MNSFMFHSLECVKTDEIIIYGTYGDYSIEVKINSDGVEVFIPDYDKEDPSLVTNVKKIFKDELIKVKEEE